MGSSSSNLEGLKASVEAAKRKLEDAQSNLRGHREKGKHTKFDAGGRRYYKSQTEAYQRAVQACKEELAWKKECLARAKEQERKNKK